MPKNRHNPGFFAGTAFISSTVSFLIPTIIRLSPLNATAKSAKKVRDASQQDFDGARQEFNHIKQEIASNHKRIIDLDCAMTRYKDYNYNINGFLEQLSALRRTGTSPLNELSLFWEMNFASDVDKTEKYSSLVFYRYNKGEPYWNCDKSGCTLKYHYIPYTSPDSGYWEKLTVINQYRNVLHSSGLKFPSLDCGYYSREFQTFAPEIYFAHETPHIIKGAKYNGQVNINFNRVFSSSISSNVILDGQTVPLIAQVQSNIPQVEAATALAGMLFQFLNGTVALFNATGGNYSVIQDSIRNNTVLLLEQMIVVNNTLIEKTLALAKTDAEYQAAQEAYTNGLSFYLPLLFLVPGGLALLTYLIFKNCSPCQKEENENALIEVDHDDPEIGVESQSVPSLAYHSLTH